MGFQTQVNAQQAPAVAGDFASSNPRAAVVAPEGGFVAGAAGVTVGRFAWVQSDGKTVLNTGTGTGKPDGFVHREQQAFITAYLGEASNVVPVGQPVTLMRTGDYFATATGSASTGGAGLGNYSNRGFFSAGTVPGAIADPAERYRVLRRFYTLAPGLIERFYAGQSTYADKLRILSGKPPVPLGRAVRAIGGFNWL